MGSAIGWLFAAVSILLAPALEAAPPEGVAVGAGYRAEVFATGVTDPIDLAPASASSLVVLDSGGPTGVGHVLYRLPIGPRGAPAADARAQPRVVVPIGPQGLPYPAGSIAVHPRSDLVFLSEFGGKRLYRLGPDGRLTLYAAGFWMLPRGAIRFDADGRLLVLDFPGQRGVPAEPDPYAEERGWFDAGEPTEGSVLYRVDVEEALPLPRRVEYWRPSLRLGVRSLGRTPSPDLQSGIAVAPRGDLFLTLLMGIFRIVEGRPVRLSELIGGRSPTACRDGEFFVYTGHRVGALQDPFGGRIVRVEEGKALTEVVGRLGSTQGLACDEGGSLFVADGARHRILRVFRSAAR
jgi:hypothetical protein